MFMFTSSCFTIDQKDRATAVSWATLSKISRMRFLTLHCYLTQIVTETETHYFFPFCVCVCVALWGESQSQKKVLKQWAHAVDLHLRFFLSWLIFEPR